jgi:hypothetical protein
MTASAGLASMARSALCGVRSVTGERVPWLTRSSVEKNARKRLRGDALHGFDACTLLGTIDVGGYTRTSSRWKTRCCTAVGVVSC